ncbi:Nramp family divalent metal transporter [Chryseosolibacter histidini]|uniref:Nramp family divalent metal transporter n=1 Tax=Chryseosolibacter histidini TaxID=2782349 RepID=UPI0020B426D4|nr:Nramp family divalent metal transporter [Chryseosolibacter histidini]
MTPDPYHITEKTIKPPPTTFIGKLKHLGPGFILSASIVGSGELIATTTLGAKAGFTAFWIIVISCLVKVAVQLEFGKHTITTGETAMQALGKLPGPRFGKGRWTVWMILLLIISKVIQLGGMIGSTAIVLNMLFGDVPVYVWVFIAALITSILIYKGYYAMVEKFSLFMTAMFTLLTVTAVFALRYTQFSFTFADVWHGQQFSLSGAIVGVAIGAFGITGVASDEILAYNYWCLEKGYAAYTGPRQNSEEWRSRARGWIKVMYLDAIMAMVIYTLVTAAFYLLGAAVLHSMGVVPEGNALIETVALIYTKSLGPGIRTVYLVGAFFVLYSSLFASLAAWTRMYSDIFGQLGWIDFFDLRQRSKVIAVLAWIFPLCWACIYLFIKLPVLMILSGGLVGSVLLFLIVFAALHFRYKRQQIARPGVLYDIALWISIISIFGVGVYGVVKIVG